MEEGSVVGGRYRVEKLVGEGGMGSVWTAVHVVTRKRMAVKVLHRRSADMFQRFEREARAASAVDHPNVVSVTDFFQGEDGAPIMVMELLAGETLRSRLEHLGRLDAAEALEIMLPVLDAVASAHEAGVVHRDLKPENIFITRAGVPKVLDFGIAMLRDDDEEARLTPSGAMMGTVRYMAPEQAMAERLVIDHRADVWALGAIFYEVLAGRGPVAGDAMGVVIANLLTKPIVPLAEVTGDLDPALCGVVDSMLSREPDDRPGLREALAALAPLRATALGSAPPTSRSAVRSDRSAVGSATTETLIERTPPPMMTQTPADARPWRWWLVPAGALVIAGGIALASRGARTHAYVHKPTVRELPSAVIAAEPLVRAPAGVTAPSASGSAPRAPGDKRRPTSASASASATPAPAPEPSVERRAGAGAAASGRKGPSGISDQVPF
jgi:serine/threonine-protein kinase